MKAKRLCITAMSVGFKFLSFYKKTTKGKTANIVVLFLSTAKMHIHYLLNLSSLVWWVGFVCPSVHLSVCLSVFLETYTFL